MGNEPRVVQSNASCSDQAISLKLLGDAYLNQAVKRPKQDFLD
jgi:hypothetical protein